MEDVDEGFGSNESNHSNFNKELIFNDLKCLNGQTVLDKNTNGDTLFNGKMLNHNSQKGDNTDDSKDLDLRHDDNLSETPSCMGFANALREQTIKNSNDRKQSNSKEVCESYLRQKSLSPTENGDNDNSNCSVNDKAVEQSGKVSPIKESFSHSNTNSKVSEIQHDCSSTEEETVLVQTNSDSVNEVNENKDSPEEGCSETMLTESETDTSCLDKMQTDIISQNKTPVKQHTSSAEGERSPFLLDDKVRNSLKGLVAKVKSSELSRESMSPAGSSVSADTDGLASPGKLQEDDISLEEETDRQESASLEDEEECILDDCEDGISMEIGSENEDDLLEIDSELSTSRTCNKEKTDPVILDESVEDYSDQKSDTKTKEETEDTNKNNAIEIDITSDNEDDDTIESVQEFTRFKHASVEKIQFEEDSNSIGNSGKINDIVNFLNHDLSGTNSPLTTSDAISIVDSKPETVDNEISDTQNGKTENRDNKNTEIACANDVKQPKENNTTSKINKDQVSTNNTIKGNENSDKISGVTNDKDTIVINESDNKDPTFNVKNVESNKNERKNSERDNMNIKSQDFNFDQVNGEKKEQAIDEVHEEVDDDDVIFEGTLMPAMRNEYQKLSLKSTVQQSVDGKEINTASKRHDVGDDNDEDDDVIFEKETKIEVPPKQNCDIPNRLSCANDGNKSVLTIENSNIDAKKDGNTLGNNFSDKVSVITSNNSSDRKRSAEDKDYAENESKRSKLDLTGLIGKLGSRVEPASIELSDDSDVEVDKPVVGDIGEENKPAADEKLEESKPEKNERLITMTEKELEDLVREKVKTYLTSQRDTLVAKLIQKVKELQQNNDLWKRQVKDLQVKVNDVTVLQQKLEKRKAATAALRQITTRNVSVQVDEGRTASSKSTKIASTPQRTVTQVPIVSGTGNGTIRLPIQQSPQGLTTPLAHGTKMVTTSYQTPSVKSLLDTTRVQKTVGSVTPAASATTTTVNTSLIEFIPYTSTIVPKPAIAPLQGFGQPAVAKMTSQSTVSKTVAVTKTVTVSKTVTLPSPNAAKVIDLTDDDDSNKTRLVTIPAGIGAVTNQPGLQHVIAAPGAQFVRTGLPNQPTYQLVFSSQPAIRPGMMMTVAPALAQTTPLLNTVQQPQTLVNLTSTSVAPGTSLARAAVSATPIAAKAPVATHPAPFPSLPPKQPTVGLKSVPPKPCLKISRVSQGIVLSWNMVLNDQHAEISNYQLFAYQETSAQPVASLWKKVGDVKALPLPMACTLTQFQVGNKYHFAVRAMDSHNRVGDFSDPGSIHLTPTNQ